MGGGVGERLNKFKFQCNLADNPERRTLKRFKDRVPELHGIEVLQKIITQETRDASLV